MGPGGDGTRSRLTLLQMGLGDTGGAIGGAERVFSELEASLPGCGVDVCSAVVSEPVDGDERRAHRHVLASPQAGLAPRLIQVRRGIAGLLRSHSVDLLASHFAFYTLPVLDMLGNRPFVVHFHGPWSAESEQEGGGAFAVKVKHAVERLVYSRADRLIVLSEAFAKLLRRQYRVDEELIRVVPGSVDMARFAVSASRTACRDLLGWPRDRRVLLAVRRLSHRMGLDLLIRAMEQVVRQEKDVLLYLGGQGGLRPDLERLVRELDLSRNVQFLGFVPEDRLPMVYRAADVNIVPTRAWEGFGLVAAEALAAGTPSLVTPIGGLPEIVGPLAPELVLHSASVNGIANGILGWLSGGLVLPDAETCRAYAAEHFSSAVMAQRTTSVYRELLH